MWIERTALRGLGVAWLLLPFAARPTLAAEAPATAVVVEVDAGAFERRETPVRLRLPDALKKSEAFTLEDLDAKAPVPVQRDGEGHITWIVRGPLAAGSKRKYRLTPSSKADADQAAEGVSAKVDGQPAEAIADDLGRHGTGSFAVDGRPVLTYHAAVAEPPAPIDPVYRRSGFIHPLRTPSGLVVTDDFPPEHAHQHGIFFAWVNSTFEGRPVDFWNQLKRAGRVSHAQGTENSGKRSRLSGGPVFGELDAELLHENLTAPGGPKAVIREDWMVRVYRIGAPFFIVDFQSVHHVLGSDLTLNKYLYGGFGIRGSRQWSDPKAKGVEPPDPSRSGHSTFLTSEGKGRADGNHTRPRWVDFSGLVDGKTGGITVLDNPANFRFPQPVRLHPNMPYFCFAPMVEEGFVLKKDHPYTSRYRLLIHDGPPDVRAIESAWHDYAEPPTARVIPNTP
ncbi:PmoA family protein [Singulisphaera sp. PoT]|uniref:DUF6807 domain-containing protein n=1 Tax=Singulisphaera sp. PoT TaxID=3411797 RepID=UPI003BF474EF